MSKASQSFVEAERSRNPNSELLSALADMSVFEQALGSRTAFYSHYALNGTRLYAKRKGLVHEKKGLVRLTAWGREVAAVACLG